MSLGILGLLVVAAAAVIFTLDAFRLRERRAGGTPIPRIQSLAVLPFDNLFGDPAQEYFSDGTTDALIGDLSQIDSLRVISRTSTMRYKKSGKSPTAIARELGVDGNAAKARSTPAAISGIPETLAHALCSARIQWMV